MRRTRRPLPLLATALLLASCGTGSFSNPFIQPVNVTLSPATLTLRPGAAARVQVTGTLGGTGETVTGLGVQVRETPVGLTATGSTGTLTVQALGDAQPGTYTIPLAVSASGARGEAQLAVTVTAPTETGYTVALTPESVELTAGQGTHVALSITPDAGFTGKPRITAATGALGVRIDPDGQGLTVTADAVTTPGAYVIAVTTESGSVRRDATLSVTVTQESQ